MEEALGLMVRAYDRLGLETLRDDAERVLRKNYPESPFGAREQAADSQRWWRLW